MMENTKTVTVTETALKTFCVGVLRHVDVATGEAELIIDNLVAADMRGVDSHGVVRLPIYVKRLAAGAINPRPAVRIVRETATSAVVDGDNGPGQWVGMKAMEIAIDKALSGACTFVSVRNSNHFGAAAYYAEMAAARDLIGFAFTIGGINHMTPWGGAAAILGNNPFAVAMPAGVESAVVLDMACSVAHAHRCGERGAGHSGRLGRGSDGVATTDALEARAITTRLRRRPLSNAPGASPRFAVLSASRWRRPHCSFRSRIPSWPAWSRACAQPPKSHRTSTSCALKFRTSSGARCGVATCSWTQPWFRNDDAQSPFAAPDTQCNSSFGITDYVAGTVPPTELIKTRVARGHRRRR